MKKNLENLRPCFVTTPLKQIFLPVPAVSGCQDIGLQSLIKKGFLNQSRNKFLKIIV